MEAESEEAGRKLDAWQQSAIWNTNKPVSAINPELETKGDRPTYS